MVIKGIDTSTIVKRTASSRHTAAPWIQQRDIRDEVKSEMKEVNRLFFIQSQ